ncbi:MAG TPA: glycoside hydrolase family 3 [Chlorobaculum parvum]|uniref:beta-N-acetylhexosaminidase n=1 Tax=Chlorobaculum parvum TaxID=274539 RepID=A0A7C5HCA0_9CHLB|nr:glycoside hydrolase family 3 [Chlorobaculum parvum]
MKQRLFAALLLLLSFTNALAAPGDSLSIKIGQMLMVGFRGFNANSDPELMQALRAGQVGGVVLFDYDVPAKSPERNIESPEQVQRLTAELQRLAPIPLFIAIDQEGGRVCRLKPARGFPPTVSAAHLGAINNADSTRQTAGSTAALLKRLGINMNLAPVVDLNVNPENPVIGKLDRSFSSDPALVARQAQLVVDALNHHGIIAALKHFPGHGSSTTDTHKDFTDVTETWNETELEPYRTLIRERYDNPVMTAHVFNAKLDRLYPATLSKATIDGLLRKQLSFRGVVISDDMQMKAISDRYGLEQAICLAINAGVDVLLFANNATNYDPGIARKANAIIHRLVEKGDVTPKRIDASYRRIMALKQRTIHPAP